jgi:hypothetical protein
MMKVNWKSLRLAILGLLVVAGSGCGGINASKGVSPATFLLPGFGQVEPKPAPDAEKAPEFAAISR